MGQIKKRDKNIHFVGDTDQDNNTVRYCSNCDTYGFKVKLGPRILRQGEHKTEDWDYYMQCTECGQLEPKESARVESDISDIVSKDDSDGYAISLDDPRLSRRIREYHFIEE